MASKSRPTASRTRRRRAKALTHPEVKTAFDIFGSELPDEAFTGVFDQPRQRDSRAVQIPPPARRHCKQQSNQQ
jgi:hypothetical protein